jgi:hypothetical protein
MTLARKFLIAVTIVTIIGGAVVVAAPSASAQTAEQLQTQIKELLAKVAELTRQLNVLQGQGTPPAPPGQIVSAEHRICNLLARNLAQGARGDDVTSLQEFLRQGGYLSANATGFFGPMTAEAVRRWQAAEGVQAVGSIGPISRERIRIWCGKSSQRQDFSASPGSGAAPLSVHFTFSPATDEAGQYWIDFGDGNGEVMQKRVIYCIRAPCISPNFATHTYTSAGSYTASVSRYIACLHSNPRCLMAEPPPLARASITVTSDAAGNRPPVISSFTGPTTLSVNETGTWTILASDPESGPLSYSIDWGDTAIMQHAPSSAARAEFVQTRHSPIHTRAQGRIRSKLLYKTRPGNKRVPRVRSVLQVRSRLFVRPTRCSAPTDRGSVALVPTVSSCARPL